jgi:hypothetical protein
MYIIGTQAVGCWQWLKRHHIIEAEESIKDNAPYDVVFDAEVGQTLFNGGGAYKLPLVLKDLTTSTTVNQQSLNGLFGDANWPGTVLQHAFPQPAAGAAADDHVYQALGHGHHYKWPEIPLRRLTNFLLRRRRDSRAVLHGLSAVASSPPPPCPECDCRRWATDPHRGCGWPIGDIDTAAASHHERRRPVQSAAGACGLPAPERGSGPRLRPATRHGKLTFSGMPAIGG